MISAHSQDTSSLTVWDGSWLLFAGLMAFCLLFGRALNVAWLVLVLMAGLAGLRPSSRGRVEPAPEHLRAIRVVGMAAALALLLKLIPQAHWGVVGRKLSMEWNVLLAVGSAWLLTWRRRLPHRSLIFLYGGVLLAGVVAVYQCHEYVLNEREDVLPTNAVNWAAGMALLLVVMASGALDRSSALEVRWLSGVSVLSLSLALFMSGRRGAYFALLFVGGLLMCRGWCALKVSGTSRFTALLAAAVVVVAWLLAASTSPLMKESVSRLVLGGKEYSQSVSKGSSQPAAVGSVGTRLFLASEGMAVVSTSPWWGVGPEGHDVLLRRLMSTTVDFMFHLHNEYVDSWVTYGILGLLSFLCVPLALLIAGWRLRVVMPVRGLVMIGMGLTHLVSGLSNVNTFHNHYQTMYAICLVLALMDWQSRTPAVTTPAARSDGVAA